MLDILILVRSISCFHLAKFTSCRVCVSLEMLGYEVCYSRGQKVIQQGQKSHRLQCIFMFARKYTML